MSTDNYRSTIVTLRKKGLPCSAIAKMLGRSVHAVQQVVYRERLSYSVQSKSPAGRRYDWAAVQQFYDIGHTRKECLIKFHMSPMAWDAAGKRGRLRLRPKIPREDFFQMRKARSTDLLRHHMKKANLLKNRCAGCGLTEWQGKPLVLDIDHINGDHFDNRKENLRELCPNCHRQTPTFGSKQRIKVKGNPTETTIKLKHQEGASDIKIASEVGCSPATVAAITKGWRRRYA